MAQPRASYLSTFERVPNPRLRFITGHRSGRGAWIRRTTPYPIEAHIFGGLTYDETAEALGISAATVDRDLRTARAWLAREIG